VALSHARRAFAAAVIGSILLGSIVSPSQVSSTEAERLSIVIRGRSVDGPHRTIRATQGTMLEPAARERAAVTAERYAAQPSTMRPMRPPTVLQRRRLAEGLSAKS
jgi:hypothetical protein